MQFHEEPRFPRGYRCASRNAGLKPAARDLSLFVSEVDASAAALFTRNHFPGAPILLGRETIRSGTLRAIVANSRCSNVATGPQGIDDARRMAAAAAAEVGTTPDKVLVSSTGVIGVRLPIEKIEAALPGMSADLTDAPLTGAAGIMTTDTHPKALSITLGDVTITWVGKGSGMIEPAMATLLVYIFTDARFDAATLDRMLRATAADSFNMLSIDTDTSTSDTCAILANGLAGPVDEEVFANTLAAGCMRMAETLARDGEGATKLIRAIVNGAASNAEARRIAKSIINSPLIKTMAHGADPNVGRVLMAVGKCFDCQVRPDSTHAAINGHDVVRHGLRIDFDEYTIRQQLAGDTVEIAVDLGIADGHAVAFGCDLTRGYIEENAAYYST
jgi:glutamate N-acetyltransferase/amino-acid N-acetyltransferase